MINVNEILLYTTKDGEIKVGRITRKNQKKQFMGLTTWKNAPTGKILKSEVSIAKNYLTEPRRRISLDRLCFIYLSKTN